LQPHKIYRRRNTALVHPSVKKRTRGHSKDKPGAKRKRDRVAGTIHVGLARNPKSRSAGEKGKPKHARKKVGEKGKPPFHCTGIFGPEEEKKRVKKNRATGGGVPKNKKKLGQKRRGDMDNGPKLKHTKQK